MKLVALAILALTLAGCDEAKPVQAAQPARPSFEVVAGSDGSLAIRKDTGQLCRTWSWSCTLDGKPTNTGSIYGISCETITRVPLCEALR